MRALEDNLKKEIFDNFYEIQSNTKATIAVKGVFPGKWEAKNKKSIGSLYLLDERRCSYHAEKPIEKILVTDVKYDLDQVKAQMKDPAVLNTVSVTCLNL